MAVEAGGELIDRGHVAEVDHQQTGPGQHDHHAGRSGESGQVLDVREMRDDERVDTGLSRRGADGRQAGRDGFRGNDHDVTRDRLVQADRVRGRCDAFIQRRHPTGCLTRMGNGRAPHLHLCCV